MQKRRQGTEVTYPFSWVDEVVEITLNPKVAEVHKIPTDLLRRIQQRFEHECSLIWSDLKNITFASDTPEQIGVIVNLYYTSIRLLQDQAKSNRDAYTTHETLTTTGDELLTILDTLKSRLDLRYGAYLNEQGKEKAITQGDLGKSKITCALTVDQIGLILKAADESRLIISSSLSMIFKTIVPYLATEFKEHLSWDSMRSNSYHPEQRDKDSAIAALEKLINKIKNG